MEIIFFNKTKFIQFGKRPFSYKFIKNFKVVVTLQKAAKIKNISNVKKVLNLNLEINFYKLISK